MLNWKLVFTGVLALPLVAALSAPADASANLNIEEMAAALVLPVITGKFGGNPLINSRGDTVLNGSEAFTLSTITNAKTTPIRLVVDVISGDNGFIGDGSDCEDSDPTDDSDANCAERNDNWRSTSFTCDLTGGETTTFVFAPANLEDSDTDLPTLSYGGSKEGSVVLVECSDLSNNDTSGDPRILFTDARVGMMVVAVADPDTGNVISQNAIFGDAVVVDPKEAAYSFNAIQFQAGHGQNNGDKIYEFNGSEYSTFPSALATNFIAPGEDSDSFSPDVEADLILFTLDGSLGTTAAPRVRLGGLAFNDDEQFFDFQHEFDCFDIIALEDINPNFKFSRTGPGLGSPTGHLQLFVQPTATPNDAHDDQYGDGNDTRRRGVHGWIVQGVPNDKTLLERDTPIVGAPEIKTEAAWGRPLGQSTLSLTPFRGDQPSTLDADTRF